MGLGNKKTESLYGKILVIVSQGLGGYKKFLEHDPKKTHMPPTGEEITNLYQNDPLFHTAVETIVSHIMDTLRTADRESG
jgi:hypothetical protein